MKGFTMNNSILQATKVIVVRENNEEYHYDFDLQELVCSHINAYIETACCSSVGSSGYVECGCGGMDAVICPNHDCERIQDYEVEDLFERLR